MRGVLVVEWEEVVKQTRLHQNQEYHKASYDELGATFFQRLETMGQF